MGRPPPFPMIRGHGHHRDVRRRRREQELRRGRRSTPRPFLDPTLGRRRHEVRHPQDAAPLPEMVERVPQPMGTPRPTRPDLVRQHDLPATVVVQSFHQSHEPAIHAAPAVHVRDILPQQHRIARAGVDRAAQRVGVAPVADHRTDIDRRDGVGAGRSEDGDGATGGEFGGEAPGMIGETAAKGRQQGGQKNDRATHGCPVHNRAGSRATSPGATGSYLYNGQAPCVDPGRAGIRFARRGGPDCPHPTPLQPAGCAPSHPARFHGPMSNLQIRPRCRRSWGKHLMAAKSAAKQHGIDEAFEPQQWSHFAHRATPAIVRGTSEPERGNPPRGSTGLGPGPHPDKRRWQAVARGDRRGRVPNLSGGRQPTGTGHAALAPGRSPTHRYRTHDHGSGHHGHL